MSTPDAPRPGWYADPDDPQELRWWDGTAWTEHRSPAQTAPAASAQPYTGGAPQHLTAPAGTDGNTPWIWLELFLPLLALLPIFFIPWGDVLHIDPSTGQPDRQASLRLLTSPAFVLSTFLPFLLFALSVLFAYLDWRELTRRGVPAPFHWAWAFLGNYVYPIGRGVVVQRRTGRGAVVMWVAIGLIVLSLVIGIGLAIWIAVSVVRQAPFSY